MQVIAQRITWLLALGCRVLQQVFILPATGSRRRWPVLGCLLLLSLLGAAAASELDPGQLPATSEAGTGPLAAMLRLSVGLVLVVALIIVVAVVLKRWLPAKWLRGASRGKRGDDAVLRLVDSIALGVKRQAMVLAVGDQWLVVGASEHGLQQLGQFPAPSPAATFAAQLASAGQHPDQQAGSQPGEPSNPAAATAKVAQ